MKWIIVLIQVLLCAIANSSPLSITLRTPPTNTPQSLDTGNQSILFILRNSTSSIIGNAQLPGSTQTAFLGIYAFQNGDRLSSLGYKGSTFGTFSIVEVK